MPKGQKMSTKTQTMMVQVIAFFTAAISVIFLRQYYQGKSIQRINQPYENQMTSQPKIFLECSEVLLSEDIVVTPIE
jgi:hypothetical protein